MTADGERLRLMAVHAHPDDESSKGAATMARYAREGVDVVVVTCTGGERGSILNPAMDRPEVVARLAEVRREELARACNVLGVRQVDLGFVDSGYPEAPEGEPLPPLEPGCFALEPVEVSGRALVELVRRERPHVLLTYDEKGGYPHPDHIRCHEVSVYAFEKAGDPDAHPDAGEPWQPSKLYYQLGFHKERVLALHEAVLATGGESPYEKWLEGWEDDPADAARLTTKVACAEEFGRRHEALLAHATQVEPPPNGPWFKVPVEVLQEIWPTEDFQLARCLVDTGVPAGEIEDDLFAGLRAPAHTP